MREKPVAATQDGHLTIGNHRLRLLREKDPSRLPWKSLNVNVVFECTGAFIRREDLEAHISAAAGFVILSAPANGDGVETIVHAVNTRHGNTSIISCASCTTNCITPVMEILGRRIGVKKAMMTTVHAYTASQALVDPAYSRPRRGRAGGANLVLTSTGAAAATARALPEYCGKFDGVAVRAPVPVGSLAMAESSASPRTRSCRPTSSRIHAPRWSISGMTQVVDDDLLTVMSWYDNEWGYSSQLVREALQIARTLDRQRAAREP
jgi:glyceraldehyde 3-phosphate dehydrogenase